MQNAGTDFIKRILKDKVRLRRWKKRLLCLSCVVVFCTVYALILPALTLERKTVCGQKEHSHTEACYSEEGQITCGMAEHVHTETCYAKDSPSADTPQENPDESLSSGTTTGDTKADGTGNTGSGDTGVSKTEGTGSGDTGVNGTEGTGSGDTGVSGTESTGSGDTGVSGTEGAGSGDTGISGTEDEGTGAGKTGIAGEASDMEDRIGLLAEDEDDGEDAAVSLAATASDGLDLNANNSYLEHAKLYYQKSDGTWEELGDNTTFENENPKIKLEISYKNISITDLQTNHSNTLVYPLPEQLRDMTTTGNITAGSTKVGTINLAEGKIVVRFEDDYLNQQHAEGNASLNGNFYTEGKIALNKLDSKGKTTITTTGKSYTLNLGPDAVAKYGQVTVDKTCQSTKVLVEEDGGYYIAYNIKVTAGEDGCPDVSVVDTLTNDLDRVDSYAEITTTATTLDTFANEQHPYEKIESGKAAGKIYYGNTTADGSVPAEGAAGAAKPGSLVWKLGNLAPNESRTLTYYVKLKDNVPLDRGEIQNKAKVFSKTYEKTEDTAFFKPEIKYDMPKSHDGNIVRNKDGSYTITYRIDFKLDKSTSNYPLKDFSIVDCLDYNNIYTDPTIRKYVSYDRDSVQLYCQKDGEIGGSPVNTSDYKIQWSKDGGTTYQDTWTETDGNPTRFKITGTDEKPIIVNPGDFYYATYTVTVKPEAMAAMKADNVTIKNRYLVSASNAQKFYGDPAIINRTYDQATVGNYKWVEKAAGGDATASDSTVAMTEDQYKYNAESHSVTKVTTSATSFTVPAGSYQYTVDVNQTLGDWDVTQVAIKDTLNSDKMQYTGYVKVEAYEYDADGQISSTATGTKWVNIDSLQTFTLKPENLGWTNNQYAYRLTYYARPVNAGSFSSAIVKNKVELKGEAVRGETRFPLDGINKETSITVSGDFKMDVKKTAWYYEDPKEEATTWKNGKLYWAIEVSGTAILNGTYFEDYISPDSGLEDSFLHADSLAGIYLGKLPEGQTLASYKSLEEFKKAGLTDVTGKFTEPSFTNKKDFTGTGNFSELKVQAKEQITLGEGGNLYIIICSEPPRLPADREDYHYKNHIRTSDNGTHWIEQSQADTYLYGGADILKELGQTFTFDGTTVTSNNDGRDIGDSSKIVTTELPGPGQYAAWVFKVNYGGDLTGRYRVLEKIPDGMELAYIRIKWVGESQNFDQINTKEISELGSDWTKKQVTAATDNGNKPKTTTYYVKGNRALVELGDFLADKIRDNHSVDVQVVCKVTDKDVLLGGQTKEFTNKVVLQTPDGQEITTATAPATIEPKKIEKSFVKNNETITFTIKANQLGQALPTVEGTKLKLIDKLSTSLRLDTTSINVVNSKTSEDLTSQCKASLREDNTLEIEIPYDQPVTITYKAMINAPPGTTVNFTNTVYWETYTPSTGTTTGQDSYSYVAGGTVSASSNIKLKITKNDQNDLATNLSGAEFQVVECVRNAEGEITELSGSKTWTGTTGADGTVTFGTGSGSDDPLMDYNKIYKVTETKAPDGYVLDSTSIYIMVPKIETGNTDYSEDVKACINDNRIQKWYESTFQLTVSNHKGEISVTKAFNDVGGNSSSPVSGTYKFGLYENADGTNGSGTSVTKKPLQIVTITYNAGDTDSKTTKFVDLELKKTYYVFELDDEGKPIINSTTVAVVNGMEYFTSYATNAASSAASNSAVNGNTVTVTNQSRVKELPSTGGYGVLIYRLAGALCIFFAGLLLLRNKLQQK